MEQRLFIYFILFKAKGHMATNILKNKKNKVNQLQLKAIKLHTRQSLLKNTNRRRLYNVII